MTTESTTLGRLATEGRLLVNDGYRTKQSELAEDGVPILRVAEVHNGFLSPTLNDRVSTSLRWKYSSKVSRPGDVVVTTKGTVGRTALVTANHPELVYSPQVCFFRPMDESLCSRFLYYWFRSTEFRDQARGVKSQTDMADYINLADIRNLTITLPSPPKQRAIAEVLGSLDDKIESNRRLAETCRELIRLELEAREDPTWCEAPVSRLARFVNGGAYTNGASRSGRMVIRIAELTKGAGGSTVYNDIDVPDDRLARPGDLLMAWSGSLGTHIWLGEEAVINQHIFKVVPDGVPAWLVFDRLERVMPEFRQIAADKATTMGHIKRHHLDDALVRVPVGQDLAELDALLGPNWSRALAADIESRTLSSLRDLLLPELLSGRLRVPVAEQSVS